jgi:hypothetical protein
LFYFFLIDEVKKYIRQFTYNFKSIYVAANLYDWRGTRMSHLEKAMDSKTLIAEITAMFRRIHKADPKYDMTELINALGKFYNEQRKVLEEIAMASLPPIWVQVSEEKDRVGEEKDIVVELPTPPQVPKVVLDMVAHELYSMCDQALKVAEGNPITQQSKAPLSRAPKTPNIPHAPKTPKIAHAPKTPKIAHALKTPKIAHAPKTPKIAHAPKTPNITQAPKTPSIQQARQAHQDPQVPSPIHQVPQDPRPIPQVSRPIPHVPRAIHQVPQVSRPIPQVPRVIHQVPQVSRPIPQDPSPIPQVSRPIPQDPSPIPQVSSPIHQVPQDHRPLYQDPSPIHQVPSPIYQAPSPIYQDPRPIQQAIISPLNQNLISPSDVVVNQPSRNDLVAELTDLCSSDFIKNFSVEILDNHKRFTTCAQIDNDDMQMSVMCAIIVYNSVILKKHTVVILEYHSKLITRHLLKNEFTALRAHFQTYNINVIDVNDRNIKTIPRFKNGSLIIATRSQDQLKYVRPILRNELYDLITYEANQVMFTNTNTDDPIMNRLNELKRGAIQHIRITSTWMLKYLEKNLANDRMFRVPRNFDRRPPPGLPLPQSKKPRLMYDKDNSYETIFGNKNN